MVLAGPGSGKTFTITSRILFLLEQGTPPEQLLVITFTREAAVSMQRRFQEMAKGFPPVCFGTFHSVFYQILKKSGALRDHKILTGSERKRILVPILKQYSTCSDNNATDNTATKSKTGDAKAREGSTRESKTAEMLGEDALAFLSAFSYYKNTLRMEEAAGKVPVEWRPQFGAILRRYEKAVRDAGGIDFDDMLCRCRELLMGDARLLRSWQERFRHILIDEFQDINPVQYEVVKLLSGSRGNVFAVGDDDQAIYGFRGSEPECLRRFEREYGAERILLDINYRSHPQIVRASLAVAAENGDRFPKALRPSPEKEREEQERKEGLRPGEDGGKRVRVLAFQEKEGQYEYLTERLRRFPEEKTEGKKTECAVLFRTNALMQGLAVRLRAAGIPFVMKEKVQSIYDHFISRDIMAYLTLAAGEWDRGTLLRIINRPSRYVSREAVGSGGGSLEELIAFYEAQGRGGAGGNGAAEKLRGFARQLKALGKLTPGLAVSYVRKAAGYEAYLRQTAKDENRLAEWLEILEWLREDAAGFPDVWRWKEAQEAYGRSLEESRAEGRKGGRIGESAADTSGPAVSLMTVHGSKGLEFDTVIVADCNESVFPYGRFQGKEEVEEERRVFYVAMTRAKEILELLYLTGTKERPRLPSRFLNPLLREI